MATAARASADVGLIGLAVMGQNLALNMADHGYRVAVYNRTTAVMEKFVAGHGDTPGGLVGAAALPDFVAALKTPRKILLLVKAGPPVDAVVEQLLGAGVEPDDIVVDCGNSLWTDTIRREKQYADRCRFFGSGVSGGEVGARFGPSLMPGGHPASWEHLRPIWEAIAAKVDPKTGKPLEDWAPGKPVTGGEPCTAYMGPDGAGHYVKMVHNGIEYVDMQLIAEAYHLLTALGGMKPDRLSEIFAEWNRNELGSYLIEITADILQQRDPAKPTRFFVDVVLDAAAQKGTGKWTSVNALDMGIPANAIAEAVFARCLSALKEERVAAAKVLKGPPPRYRGSKPKLVEAIRARALLLEDLRVCAGLPAHGRGAEGIQVDARLRHHRRHLARRLHHPRALPPEDHRGLPQEPRPREPHARPLLQEGPRRAARNRGARSWRSRCGTASPCPHSGARCPTSTATDRRGSPPTSSRPSAITSARTPTSAWTRRAGSSSTWTGQTRSARSSPSDRV